MPFAAAFFDHHPALRAALILLLFAAALALIYTRPRQLPEAWAASGGGALLLLLGLVSVHQALRDTAQASGALLFLPALLFLSALLDQSGFFAWAARHGARAAKGDSRVLFRNIIILGTCVTALLSLDTTAVLLTPIALALVRALRLPARPFLIACAFIANAASLLLPVSNLTNLLFQGALHLRFATFAARMALPEIAAALVNFWLLRWVFAKELPKTFETEGLEAPKDAIADGPYFYAGIFALVAVTIGYFVGTWTKTPPYAVAWAGSIALWLFGLWRRRAKWADIFQIAWSLIPFVIGLLILTRGLESLGLAGWTRMALALAGPRDGWLLAAFGSAAGSNILNNLPMALLALHGLSSAHGSLTPYGALIGCDIGPNLTLTGSLATLLVATSARARGESLTARDVLWAGIRVTPFALIAALLALWAGAS